MSESILSGPALDTLDVSRAVRWSARTLAFPNHLAQAVHRLMVCVMQRVSLCSQQLDRLPNAARLVNRALLADRQMHRQVQEGIGLASFNVVHFFQCHIRVGKIAMVFGVLGYPLTCYGFKSFQGLT